MVVCICNRITEAEVREASSKGARTPESAYAQLGCEPQCGCCLDYAQELIEEERARVRICASSQPEITLSYSRAFVSGCRAGVRQG